MPTPDLTIANKPSKLRIQTAQSKGRRLAVQEAKAKGPHSTSSYAHWFCVTIGLLLPDGFKPWHAVCFDKQRPILGERIGQKPNQLVRCGRGSERADLVSPGEKNLEVRVVSSSLLPQPFYPVQHYLANLSVLFTGLVDSCFPCLLSFVPNKRRPAGSPLALRIRASTARRSASSRSSLVSVSGPLYLLNIHFQ